jgi:hypothetical protein
VPRSRRQRWILELVETSHPPSNHSTVAYVSYAGRVAFHSIAEGVVEVADGELPSKSRHSETEWGARVRWAGRSPCSIMYCENANG